MKKCSYCGRENFDDLTFCSECGTELPPEQKIIQQPKVEITFEDEDKEFETQALVPGVFTWPDRKDISGRIRGSIPRNEWNMAWREVVDDWLRRFAGELGADYILDESHNFLLLCAFEEPDRKQVLRFAERALSYIEGKLKGIQRPELFGPHVIILFENSNDYYRYISYFYPDGAFANSSGVFIRRGYGHIAIPCYLETSITTGQKFVVNNRMFATIAHEMVHNVLMAMALPRWFEEGLAMLFESELVRQRTRGLDREMAERHWEFWNSNNIQEFWRGKSFHSPEAAELSYDLSRQMINLIASSGGDFKGFCQEANWKDAGEAASFKHLGQSLGAIVGEFLGPGEWAPAAVKK